jgi:hypothetical protein
MLKMGSTACWKFLDGMYKRANSMSEVFQAHDETVSIACWKLLDSMFKPRTIWDTIFFLFEHAVELI